VQQTSRNKKFATQHCVFGRPSRWAPPGGDYLYDTDDEYNTDNTYDMYDKPWPRLSVKWLVNEQLAMPHH